MPRKQIPGKVTPTLPYDRAIIALKTQLANLQEFKGRHFDEANADETGWEHLTQSIIEATFGNPSSNLNKFYSARNAGYHNIGGVPPHVRQQNFEERIREYEVLVRSLIAELHLYLPQDIKGAYGPGEEYDFYRDLSSIVAEARREALIVDAYLDEEIFNLYVAKITIGVNVRILSNGLRSNVEAVARKYAVNTPLSLRVSSLIHDRCLFVDDRAWVIGQSIKDAAKRKPTYIVELEEPVLSNVHQAHLSIWSTAAVII